MADNFMRRGNAKILFIATMAAPAAPSLATDITGAEDITEEVRDISGFTSTGTFINTPNFASRVVGKIPGTDELADSSMIIYEKDEDASNELRTVLAKDTAGFILMAPHGGDGVAGALEVAQLVDVFPVQVASTPRIWDSGDEAATWRCDFALTAEPSVDVAIVT